MITYSEIVSLNTYIFLNLISGYILGEFGNLIAGDARSAPLVQFRLLHSKYHLCSIGTRGLLLTTYVKFINLFPEIKTVIEDIFKTDSNLRSSDAELQQRACEYLALSRVATLDVLATVNFIKSFIKHFIKDLKFELI